MTNLLELVIDKRRYFEEVFDERWYTVKSNLNDRAKGLFGANKPFEYEICLRGEINIEYLKIYFSVTDFEGEIFHKIETAGRKFGRQKINGTFENCQILSLDAEIFLDSDWANLIKESITTAIKDFKPLIEMLDENGEYYYVDVETKNS